jgi:hypothetical protein
MHPKKPTMLAKQPNLVVVHQPTQFKVPQKKRLTEKPADWTQE